MKIDAAKAFQSHYTEQLAVNSLFACGKQSAAGKDNTGCKG